MYTEYRRVNQK